MKAEKAILNEVGKARLERVWAILKLLEITKPNAEIERRMGGSPGNISKYLNGKIQMSDNFYQKFIEKFPVEQDSKIEKLIKENSYLKNEIIEKDKKIKSDGIVMQSLTDKIENLEKIIFDLKKGGIPRKMEKLG